MIVIHLTDDSHGLCGTQSGKLAANAMLSSLIVIIMYGHGLLHSSSHQTDIIITERRQRMTAQTTATM
jgi:hypothetical protein